MWNKVQDTVKFLKNKGITSPDYGIILGTGLGNLVEKISIEIAIPYSEIPNFPVSTVEGHSGELIFGTIGTKKVVAMRAILSDGSEAEFKSLSVEEFHQKTSSDSLEGLLYKHLFQELSKKGVQKEIKAEFPKSEIHRRNTGYAVDELLSFTLFGDSSDDFNMCHFH